MIRLKQAWVLVFLFGCVGKAGDGSGDQENYVAAAEVEGLQAPKVLAEPPEIEPAGAGLEAAPSINGKLPERPSITPEVKESPMRQPDGEPWAPNSPLYEVFKEDVKLQSDVVGGEQ